MASNFEIAYRQTSEEAWDMAEMLQVTNETVAVSQPPVYVPIGMAEMQDALDEAMEPVPEEMKHSMALESLAGMIQQWIMESHQSPEVYVFEDVEVQHGVVTTETGEVMTETGAVLIGLSPLGHTSLDAVEETLKVYIHAHGLVLDRDVFLV